jgi:HEAT repeat protein
MAGKQEVSRLPKENDVEVRREAVKRSRGSGPDAVPLLLQSLEDPSWRVRNLAIEVLLHEHEAEQYVQGLITLLYKNDNAAARNSAIEGLVRLNGRITPHLIEAYKTDDRDVRKFIIDILGGFEDERSLPLMIGALGDDDENVRATAIEHIGKVRIPSAVDALIAVLEKADAWTAYPAAEALGRIGDRKAVPSLIAALQKKTLRIPSIKALGFIGDPASVRHIIPFLEDPSRGVQEEVLRALEEFSRKGIDEEFIRGEINGRLGERFLDILTMHSRSGKREVKVPAMLLLGLMRDERACEPLLELSDEEDYYPEVKRAFLSIAEKNPGLLPGLMSRERYTRKRFVCEVAVEIAQKEYYPVFLRLLSDDDGHIRSLAASGAAKTGGKDAIPHIKKLLSDPYEDVQEASVAALASLNRWLSFDEFSALLHAPDPVLRKNAALILGNSCGSEAVQKLGFALKDGDLRVRKACVDSLSLLGSELSVPYLISALTDEAPEIRTAAALSLGRLGGAAAFEALTLLVSDIEDSVRAAVAKAIGELKDRRAVKHLIGLLSDKSGLVVTSAIEALGQTGGDEAFSALTAMLPSPDREIRRTAIKNLSSFSNVEDAILPFLNDNDWATRMAAVDLLSARRGENIRHALEKLFEREKDPVVRMSLERLFASKKKR